MTIRIQLRFVQNLWVLGLLVLLAGCASVGSVDDEKQRALRQLLTLIDQRLALAPLVAQAKWNSGAAIDDPRREEVILADVTAQAEKVGLPPTFARRFFQAQFDAGKLIQHRLHEQWPHAGQAHFSSAPDLARDVRPILDQITPQMIGALHSIYPALGDPTLTRTINAESLELIRGEFDGAPRAIALRPLLD